MKITASNWLWVTACLMLATIALALLAGWLAQRLNF
jgi:putative effector of murein hydrolase LrgA (UPF0299 family)